MGNEQNLNFHSTFKLSRPRMAEVLAVVSRRGTVSAADLAETSLGKNMRRPYLSWGAYSGLLEQDDRSRFRLSVLGESVLTYDSSMNQSDTQWLMHFHLAHRDGLSPAFLEQIVKTFFGRSLPLTVQSLTPVISDAHGWSHSEASAKKSAGIFLSTYGDGDSLGPLGLLRQVSESPRTYLPDAPIQLVSTLGFLYCLIETWSIRQPETDTMPLDDVFLTAGLADSLVLDNDEVDDHLGRLKSMRLLDVYRTAPPYQIVRFWSDSEVAKRDVLERMYTHGP